MDIIQIFVIFFCMKKINTCLPAIVILPNYFNPLETFLHSIYLIHLVFLNQKKKKCLFYTSFCETQMKLTLMGNVLGCFHSALLCNHDSDLEFWQNQLGNGIALPQEEMLRTFQWQCHTLKSIWSVLLSLALQKQ